MSIDSNKVYYAYTEHVDADEEEWTRGEWRPADTTRATIAMKIEANVVTYGVSICSNGDNFNKEIGRKLAEERLNAFYCSFVIRDKIYHKFKDHHQMALYFLNNITNSTQNSLRRTQQRIGQWNKEEQNKSTLEEVVSKISR